eukprot:773257-Rhodomonas_salina.1
MQQLKRHKLPHPMSSKRPKLLKSSRPREHDLVAEAGFLASNNFTSKTHSFFALWPAFRSSEQEDASLHCVHRRADGGTDPVPAVQRQG